MRKNDFCFFSLMLFINIGEGETNMSRKNNRINVPEAREAMDKFKMEAANEVDVPKTYRK